MPDMEEPYCIRSLSFPMRLSATGEVCCRIHITQGTTLTIGRSKKSCDVTFDDTRVSRKHCQLRLLPHSNTLLLLDGATTSANDTEISQFVENLESSDAIGLHSLQNGVLGDESHLKQLKGLPEDCRNFRNANKLRRKAKLLQNPKEKCRRVESPSSRAVKHKLPMEVSGHQWKLSLNGLFVNGREARARVMVLRPGDEVSLVGPTEDGRSLDSDCHAAIGFIIEARPTVEKAVTATSRLLLPLITEKAKGNHLSAPDLGCIGSSCKGIDFNEMQDKPQEFLSVESAHCDQHLRAANRCSEIAKPMNCNQSPKTSTQTGDSSTNCSSKLGSADQVQERNSRSPVPFNVQAAQLNEANSSIDLDHKLLSTFNLLKASIRLRSDLLNCNSVGSSQNEPSFMDAEERVHSVLGISTRNDFQAGPTMHTLGKDTEFCGSPSEKQVGNCVNKKDVCFSFDHTVKVGSIPLPQAVLPNSVLIKNLEGYGMSGLEKGASVSPIRASLSKQDSFLKGSSLVNSANTKSSQFTETMLVHSSSYTDRAPDVLSQMLDVVAGERSFVNFFVSTETKGSPLEGFVSGVNPTKGCVDVLQTPAQGQIKDENAVEAETSCEPSCANDTGTMMVEAVAASLTVMQVNEELFEGQAGSKENINAVHLLDDGCTIERLLQGQVLNDGSCRRNWLDSTKIGQAPGHITDEGKEDVCCQNSQIDVAASKCTIKGMGSICCNGDLMTLNTLPRTDSKEMPVNGNVKTKDMEFMQREETFDVQNLELKEKICSLDVQKHLQYTCTLGSIRSKVHTLAVEDVQAIMKSADVEGEQVNALQEPGQQDVPYSVNVKEDVHDFSIVGPCRSGQKEVDLCKDFSQCEIEKGFVPETASNTDQVLTTLQPDHGINLVACEELDCGKETLDGGVALETDKDLCRSGLWYTQSLVAGVQADEVADMNVSKVQTGGYFLNQLEDVTTLAADWDNTVHLWDLLALADDVQALFIATFTYDIEWFLSADGLSRDIPVTVACHDAKRCWSKASKDRFEKPYLDWPNVSLVYPPFPRSNAIGSKGGIGCHHPKIFLVRRSGSLRVIVSSANLTHKQWFRVTNNVWWQDFSCRQTPDFRCLFRGEKEAKSNASPDFASQLAMFLAALLVDAPSEAHWVTDLAAFDFSNADGSLVASVPGLHHPLFQNAPQFLMTLNKESFSPSLQEDAIVSSFLGVVPTMVAGIKYRFGPSADRNGTRIRCLATALNDTIAYEGSTMPVLLKRAKYLKADPNAVSVVVTSRANGCSQDLFLQQDLHDKEINTMEAEVFDTEKGFIKLGFLTRDVASWLAVLCDQGFFSFAACIWPSEALAVASGQSDGLAKLALYVFQGPKFSTLSPTAMTSEERGAFSRLVKSLHNTWGLWRLEKVLCRYNWAESFESDFYFASSSIGTSLDAKFLAAFAAAAGRRADSLIPSQDSDPQWGCWTAEKEAVNPSIGVVFPTIDRVRQCNFLHYGLLCFAESAWLRLKSTRLLHDAVPYPPEREGFPMHIKVARRRFRDPLSSQTYGWIYCGSHNFSPAAWGRPIWRAIDWQAATDAGSVLGSCLHICNYELGIVLIEPPPDEGSSMGKKQPDRRGLDRFVLPFKVPPPMYREDDRPATGKAMMEALMEMRALQLKAAEEDVAVMQSEDKLDEACLVQKEDGAACDAEEVRAEQVYVEALWSQIDDEDKKGKGFGVDEG